MRTTQLALLKWRFLFVFILTARIAFGQEQYLKEDLGRLDSIENTGASDTSSAMLSALYYVGFAYTTVNYDSTNFYADRLLNSAQSVSNNYSLADAYYLKGIIFQDGIGDYQKAFEFYNKSLQKYQLLEDSNMIGNLYNALGLLQLDEGQYEEAFLFYKKAINYLNYPDDKAVTLVNIINNRLAQDEKDTARHYLNFLHPSKMDSSELSMPYYHESIARYFEYNQEYDSALYYYTICENFARKKALKSSLADYYWNKAVVYNKLQKPRKSLEYYNKAIPLFSSSLPLSRKELVYRERAATWFKLREFEKASEGYQYALLIRDSINENSVDKKLLTFLSDERNKLLLEQSKLQSDIEAANLHHELDEQSFFKTISVVAAIGFLTIVFILFFFNRHLKDRSLEIQQQSILLSNSNQMQKRMLGIITHDLRSPLASVKEMIQLLEMGMMNEISEEDRKKLLLSINTKVDNTLKNMNETLHWVNSQLRGISINQERFELSPMIEQINQNHADFIKSKNIRLKAGTRADCTVFSDKAGIQLVLNNLVHNAIKFSPEGETVSLIVSHEGDKCLVDVINFGKPIPKEKQAAIFSEGIDSQAGSAGEVGTGLGLYNCFQILEKLEESIRFESDEKHTKFSFTISRQEA